jgi:hypothetical protein
MLEILASVRACREKPFATLTNLVIGHAAAMSGCLCILVNWDEARRELVRVLQSLGVPLRVFLIAPEGSAAPKDLGPMAGEPENFFHLEAGRIEEGLRRRISGATSFANAAMAGRS